VVAIRYKVKNIGKPYAGKPHVRFDERGLGTQSSTLREANYGRDRLASEHLGLK